MCLLDRKHITSTCYEWGILIANGKDKVLNGFYVLAREDKSQGPETLVGIVTCKYMGFHKYLNDSCCDLAWLGYKVWRVTQSV